MDGLPQIALVGALFYRFEQFLFGKNKDQGPEPKGLFNEQFDFLLWPFGMFKDQVPTLDIGPDLGKAIGLHQGLEFLHGKEVFSTDIDSPEQGDPGFHIPKSTGFNWDSAFPYGLPSFKFGWGYPIPCKIALVQVQQFPIHRLYKLAPVLGGNFPCLDFYVPNGPIFGHGIQYDLLDGL